MRSILIVGAGQAGLQLALSLLVEGYQVTIMSARTPEEIRTGWPLSTQVMFEPALATERAYGLNLWEAQTPPLHGLEVTVTEPTRQTHPLTVRAELEHPGRSCDQRIKMAGWLELAEQRGAQVVYNAVSTHDLDVLARMGRYDLTIVAAGRGDIAAAFDRDPDRSPYTVPQRGLAACYVRGLRPAPTWPTEHVTDHMISGLGNLFIVPTLSVDGPCDILFWLARPGSPLDRWPAGPSRVAPAEHLAVTLDLIRTYLPAVYERCADVELADARATLHGRYAPTVRRPVAHLPSGGAVLGIADVVIANDPLTGQGANTAAKAADHYRTAILAHGERPFDATWMHQTFESFWTRHGRAVTEWTNLMLQPAQHVQQLLKVAATDPATARRLANGFTDPNEFDSWLTTPPAAAAYLATLAQAS